MSYCKQKWGTIIGQLLGDNYSLYVVTYYFIH